MKRYALLLAVFMLTACASTTTVPSTHVPNDTPLATPISTPSPTDIPAPTPHPQITLIQDATLYAGPGNVGYEALAELSAGDPVTLTGIYRDFVRVETPLIQTDTLEGFIWIGALESLPDDLPELAVDDVPWIETDALDLFYYPGAVTENGRFSVDAGDEWYGFDTGPIPVTGPFRVVLDMSGSRGDFVAIALSGRINQPDSPWWEGIHRIWAGQTAGNQLQIDVRDGRAETSVAHIRFPNVHPGTQAFSIAFLDSQGRQVAVLDRQGEIVRTIDITGLDEISLPDGLLPDGVLYIGVLVSPNGHLELSEFRLLEPPTGEFAEAVPEPLPLHELADPHGIQMGTQLVWSGLLNLDYLHIVSREFNRVVLEDFHWAYIRPDQDTYDFSRVDAAVAFAERHGMQVEGHHLAWGSRELLPGWLLSGNFSRDELINILHDHVTTVVSRYRGRVHAWSAINETVERRLYGGDFWYDNIGPEYVEMVFQWAHEADPEAVLILNGDNNEDRSNPFNRQISDATYLLVEDLVSRGVPIHAIGMQMHLLSPFDRYTTPPDRAAVADNMRRFAELGVDIYITEFDVSIQNMEGTREERLALQAQIYGDMLGACIDSGVCRAFSAFGFSDAVTWYNDCEGCLNLPDADPLIFDEGYQPKPAYYALLEALSQP